MDCNSKDGNGNSLIPPSRIIILLPCGCLQLIKKKGGENNRHANNLTIGWKTIFQKSEDLNFICERSFTRKFDIEFPGVYGTDDFRESLVVVETFRRSVFYYTMGKIPNIYGSGKLFD